MTGQLAADVVLPTGALVAVLILGLVELGLAIFCIVDIVRRPAVLGGHKWLWIVLVVVFNLVGSIVYLAVGRQQPPAPEPSGDGDMSARSRTQAAADLLYGPVAAEAATAAPQPAADEAQSGTPMAQPGAPQAQPGTPQAQPGGPSPGDAPASAGESERP